jgi:ABC-type glycerol-3-phosphate transport system substrate-binding protein
MRRSFGVIAAVALCGALAVSAAQGAPRKQSVTNLTFATYVWQPTTVAAVKSIVDSWNARHPQIQVQIQSVDVNSVHDKLLTSFVGGTAADVIQDEAADIAGFTGQGYLANLTPMIPKPFKRSIPKAVWDTVNYSHKITGVPIMLQTYNVFANMDALRAGGVAAPTIKKPWTWTQFRAAAKKLSTGGNYGVCWGLRSPTAAIQTLSLNWGAQWSYLVKGKWTLKVGPAEQTMLTTIHDMIYVDKSIDPAAVGLSGSAVLPAFFGGKCAMTVQGNFQVQGMLEQAPKSFNWAMFPPLKGKTQDQVANPQTLSISQQSQHKKEAMQFIAYALNAQNMAKLANGDWLIPVNPAAGAIVAKTSKAPAAFANAVSAIPSIKKGNWVSIPYYARWKAEVATPAFVSYLANRIDLSQLTNQLVSGWEQARGR